MDMLEFTDEEIREELARLGYESVPTDKLSDFKKDLLNLISSERSKTNSLNSSTHSFEEHRQAASPIENDSPESVSRNFTNHGSQWIDQDLKDDWRTNKEGVPASSSSQFREDWQYRGRDKTTNARNYDILDEVFSGQGSKRPTTAPSGSDRQSRVPASYSNYELPLNVNKEHTKENENQSNILDNYSEEEGSKYIKRKTSRKLPDGCRKVDESFCESETDGIFEIYEKIKGMAMRDCECGKNRPTTADSEPPYRLKSRNDYPSFIKKKEPPHTRNLVRTKPFDRMQMYRQLWKKQPPIGEGDRTRIVKCMHAKMLQKEEIKVDHKIYVPNTYVVPTSKNRTNLRWKVRQALERYEMPASGFYHET